MSRLIDLPHHSRFAFSRHGQHVWEAVNLDTTKCLAKCPNLVCQFTVLHFQIHGISVWIDPSFSGHAIFRSCIFSASKYCQYSTITRKRCETRCRLLLFTNWKPHARLVVKSVTANNLERRNGCYLCYTQFDARCLCSFLYLILVINEPPEVFCYPDSNLSDGRSAIGQKYISETIRVVRKLTETFRPPIPKFSHGGG